MGGIGRELVKKLPIFATGSLLIGGGLKAIDNKRNGKSVFGKEKLTRREETYVDWHGNVILGTRDGQVV